MDDLEFEAKQMAARRLYDSLLSVQSPFLKAEVLFDARGFAHLRQSRCRERPKDEQSLRFALLPLAIAVLKTATTAQEYRRKFVPSRNTGTQKPSFTRDSVEWWGFVSIYVKQDIGVRVVVRRVAEGNFHFWSVMPYAIPAKVRLNKWDEED